jgi:tape measure domain-containing protein
MKIYEYIIRLKDQSSDKLNRLASSFSGTSTRAERLSGATDRLGNKLGGLNNPAAKATNSMSGFGNALGSLVTRFIGPAAIIASVAMFGQKLIKLGSEAEQTRVSFEVFLGSVEKAKTLISEVTALANVTPFTRTDLLDSSKLMLNFGIANEKILPNLKMLGDISGGNAQKLHLMTLAFSQSAAAGRLMGQDLLQMVNAGFNPLQEISKKTGLSMVYLKKKMEDGAISTKMVESAFKSATSEGGLFFGMMDKQSQTIEGKMSTLSDKLGIIFTQVGENLNRIWSPFLDKILKIMDKGNIGSAISDYKSSKGKQMELQSLYGAYKDAKGTPFEKDFESQILDKFPELGTDFSTGKAKNLSENKVATKLSALAKARDNAFGEVGEAYRSIARKQDQIEKLQAEINSGKESDSSPMQRMLGLDKLSDADIKNRIADISKLADEIKDIQKMYAEFKQTPDAARLLFNAIKGGTGPVYNFDDPAKSGKGKKLKEGINGITGGGKQSVNVTINLQSLIAEQNNSFTTVREGVAEIERLVTEALLRVVNSATYAATQ